MEFNLRSAQDLGKLSFTTCAKCGSKIPQFQIDHYKARGFELSYCRDFIARTECFPKELKKQKISDFLGSKYNKDLEPFLSTDKADMFYQTFWKSELKKHKLIENADGTFFKDLEYHYYKDKAYLKANAISLAPNSNPIPIKHWPYDDYANTYINIIN
jgi:hypothetical protein